MLPHIQYAVCMYVRILYYTIDHTMYISVCIVIHCPHLQLYNKFPNEAMLLNLSAVKPPDMTISPGSINFTLPGQVVALVRSANKTVQEAFTLGVVRSYNFLNRTKFHSISAALHSQIQIIPELCHL